MRTPMRHTLLGSVALATTMTFSLRASAQGNAPSTPADFGSEMARSSSTTVSPTDAPPLERPHKAHHLSPRWDAGFGVRADYIHHDGFDLVGDDNAMPQFSLFASRRLVHERRLSLAAGLAWDVGGRSGTTRDLKVGLTTHRLTIPVEGRFSYAPWTYSFAKLSLGASAMSISVTDSAYPGPLEGTKWTFAGDLAVGQALRIGELGRIRRHPVDFWLKTELGYTWTPAVSLKASPSVDESKHLASFGETDLGNLALRGLFFRISASVSY